MADSELEILTAAVSDEEPCGPDLDLTGDLDYMNFIARAEGLLPTSFFRDGKPFDRGTVDFAAEFDAAKPFLEQTRDLRLLTLLARFHLLDRNLAGFDLYIRAICSLINEHWEGVHPRGEDGNFTVRMAALETLDDAPTVVLPLQFVPLVNSRRFGPITYRDYMIAKGEATAPEGDGGSEPIDLSNFDKALMEAEFDGLLAMLRLFESARETLGNIRKQWIEHAGFDQAVNIEKAPQLIGRIVALLQGVAVRRDPTLAPAEPAAAEDAETPAAAAGRPSIAAGRIKSIADATEALAAAADYFSRHEPSNPALLLVRQAEQLVGKSFVEVLQIVLPAYFGQASVAVGGPLPFQLSMEALSALQTSSANGGWGDSETVGSSNGDATPDDTVTENGGSIEAARPRLRAETRQDSLALLDQVSAYYRVAEPSSPIAVITERARKLAERDFMGLLQEFLPDNFRPPPP